MSSPVLFGFMFLCVFVFQFIVCPCFYVYVHNMSAIFRSVLSKQLSALYHLFGLKKILQIFIFFRNILLFFSPIFMNYLCAQGTRVQKSIFFQKQTKRINTSFMFTNNGVCANLSCLYITFNRAVHRSLIFWKCCFICLSLLCSAFCA